MATHETVSIGNKKSKLFFENLTFNIQYSMLSERQTERHTRLKDDKTEIEY